MATITTPPIAAKVETIGQPKPSQFGEGTYRPVLFQTVDGQKIWKSYNELPTGIVKGASVTLLQKTGKDGKLEYDVLVGAIAPEQTTNSQPTTANTQPPSMNADQKRAIAGYIEEMGSLYAFCLSTAQNKIGASTDGETVRCMASSLFIAARSLSVFKVFPFQQCLKLEKAESCLVNSFY